MSIHIVVIFITGAATLALELLASRIMTPYFGVSLYIWTGILSITLVSLALGYYIGGRLAANQQNNVRNEFLFVLMPAISAISMGIACLIYPWAFFQLAQANLIAGSFIACTILLFFPLVTISAMNPLLIAMRTVTKKDGTDKADGGSGLVFFISTIGSVIGVWLTAFVFIPNITNFKSVLILGLTLAFISLIANFGTKNIGGKQKKYIALASLAGLILCSVLLSISADYLNKNSAITFNEYIWKIEKEYTSLFGNIKILSITTQDPPAPDAPRMPIRMYYQDGIMQNTVDQQGISQDTYAYAMLALSTATITNDTRILVLGLAGGIIPMALANKGINVDVVEINPDAVIAAQESFGFDLRQVNVYQTDARSYVKRCNKPYHMIIVDLFQGDGVPDYLLSRDFFRDLKNCVHSDGAVIFNTFTIPRFMGAYYHILTTVKSEFAQLYMFHDELMDDKETTGIYLVAGNRDYKPAINLSLKNVPTYIQNRLHRIFSRTRAIDQELLSRSTVITDEYNTFPLLNIDNHLGYRRTAISAVPYQFLVN